MEQRLDILRDGKVIDEDISIACKQIHNKIFVLRNLQEVPSYVTLMTHLAMAAQRIKENNPVEAMDVNIIAELKKQDNYDEALAMTDEILSYFEFSIPVEEIDYIMLHLLNTLKED